MQRSLIRSFGMCRFFLGVDCVQDLRKNLCRKWSFAAGREDWTAAVVPG
jgi:hypothetical protein